MKSGEKTTIKFTIKFQCTENGVVVADTYGDFKFTVTTSGGTFTVNSANMHRLVIT